MKLLPGHIYMNINSSHNVLIHPKPYSGQIVMHPARIIITHYDANTQYN